MTVHRRAGVLLCHYCGLRRPIPSKCPLCGGEVLQPIGFGTEKVESNVSHLFPKANVRRMDADSMSRKEAYRETLRNFRTGKIDILVGTHALIQKEVEFRDLAVAVVDEQREDVDVVQSLEVGRHFRSGDELDARLYRLDDETDVGSAAHRLPQRIEAATAATVIGEE